MNERAGRYLELDVLRGIAALIVVFSHYLPHLHRYAQDVMLPAEPRQVMEWGHYAVKLFFAISGFVIFMTLERCRTLTDFLILRATRLYPAYWVALLVTAGAGVLFFGEVLWAGGIVINATMLQEFFGVPHMDAVYWSLTVELAFYANVAVWLALGWHRRPLRIVTVWLLASAVWAVTGFEYSEGNAERSGWLAYVFALDYAAYFALGMVFYEARSGWSRGKMALIAAAIVVEGLLFRWEGAAVAATVAAVLLAADRGWLRGLINPLTLWLGAISFCLYLIHRKLGMQFSLWLRDYVTSGWAVLAITTAAALLLASALTYGVEQPALRRLRSRLFKGARS